MDRDINRRVFFKEIRCFIRDLRTPDDNQATLVLLADACRHGHIQSPIPHITGKAEDIDPADSLNDLVHGTAPIQKRQEFV
jgi:hypothetical protein